MDGTLNFFVDSGAPGLYNKFRKVHKSGVMGTHSKDRGHDTYEWTETEEFRQYALNHIRMIKRLRKVGMNIIFSNLDIIHNAEKTWEMQKFYERHGVRPMPVFHLGEDFKYLDRYLDEGYEYICIGGLVPNPTSVLVPMLDHLWSNKLTKPNGMPKVKAHAFGVTAVTMMVKYPWYSVDSTSWMKFAAYGTILIPRLNSKHLPNYRIEPRTYYVSPLGLNQRTKKSFHNHLMYDRQFRKFIDGLFKEYGIPLGKTRYRFESKGYQCQPNENIYLRKPLRKGSIFSHREARYDYTKTLKRLVEQNRLDHPKKDQVLVQEVLEKGLENDLGLRAAWNQRFYSNVLKTIPEWPWPITKIQDTQRNLI